MYSPVPPSPMSRWESAVPSAPTRLRRKLFVPGRRWMPWGQLAVPAQPDGLGARVSVADLEHQAQLESLESRACLGLRVPSQTFNHSSIRSNNPRVLRRVPHRILSLTCKPRWVLLVPEALQVCEALLVLKGLWDLKEIREIQEQWDPQEWLAHLD